MEELRIFLADYGSTLTGIAVLGIVLLGILKYCAVFAKLPEEKRHYLYLFLSVGFSAGLSALALILRGGFDWRFFLSLTAATLALNQTFYNIFKATPLCALSQKLLSLFRQYAEKKNAVAPKTADVTAEKETQQHEEKK